MKHTHSRYMKGYGFVRGEGIFDQIFKLGSKIISNPTIQQTAKKGITTALDSGAKRLGTNVGERVADKIIKPKKKESTHSLTQPSQSVQQKSTVESSVKSNAELLRELYGSGLGKRHRKHKRIKQRGGGIKIL